MAIQNKKPTAKASSKTDAMKAMTEPKRGNKADEVVVAASTASTTVTTPRPAPAPPKPLITRQIPTSALGRRAKDEEAEEATEDDSPDVAEAKAKGKEEIPLDLKVWQWVDDKGAYIHMKTGEMREADEFQKPKADGEDSSIDDEWGDSQAPAGW